jgi:hypothetical protein
MLLTVLSCHEQFDVRHFSRIVSVGMVRYKQFLYALDILCEGKLLE